MSSRRVTDEEGRIWECKPETEEAPGCDVNLVCTTAGLRAPVRLKVSWQWARIAEKGLARMIVAAERDAEANAPVAGPPAAPSYGRTSGGAPKKPTTRRIRPSAANS